MRWTDLKECCDYYNINYKSLCTYMQKNKISKEEAFSHYYQYYKYNRFTYNHVTYDSFAACCMAYEIKPICVRRYAKRKHFLLRHALSSYLNYHNKNIFLRTGIYYIYIMLQSIWMQCILCVGIRKTARNIQRRSFEILYQSVSLKAVRNRAWRKNCSAQEAFRHCLKRKKHLEMDAFYYKGDRYKDLKECCKQYGINVQSVHSYRFRNKDSDYDEAIDYIRKITKQRQFIWEDGSVYESINSFCRMKSISVSSVRDKARKKGMSLQEAAKYYIERNSYD